MAENFGQEREESKYKGTMDTARGNSPHREKAGPIRDGTPEKPVGPVEPLGCPKLLIFDFDGTIADTFAAGLEILNVLSEEFGYRRLEGADIEKGAGHAHAAVDEISRYSRWRR